MLSAKEEKAIETLNANNGWGLDYDEFAALVAKHLAARNRGDRHEMEVIEYRLTDVNFHTSCELLSEGKYQEALEHEGMKMTQLLKIQFANDAAQVFPL